RELSLELGARMLVGCRAEADSKVARARLEKALDSGSAWKTFVALVEAQGGDARTLDRENGLPSAPVTRVVGAERRGVVTSIDTFALGELSVSIGAGRRSKEQSIDPRVGFLFQVRVGDAVEAGAPLATLHLAEENPEASARLAACVRIGPEP